MPPDSPSGGGGSGGGMHGGTSPGPLPSPVPSFAPGSICEADSWCWYAPLPSGSTWSAVGGAGQTDLWIGGSTQNLLHFDSGRWHAMISPLDVSGIWAASEDDVWLVGHLVAGGRGFAAIAHSDGVAVTVIATFATFALTDVWGSGPNDVYAVGESMLHHWDGTSWTLVPGVSGQTIDGTGANDVWVGGNGMFGDGMFHFDGTSWSGVPEFQGATVVDLSTKTPGEVWAITSRGSGRNVERFDGGSSTVMLRTEDVLLAIQVVSDDDVWIVGWATRPVIISGPPPGAAYHFDGNAWSPRLTAPRTLSAVARTSGLGIVAVGSEGGIVQLVADPVPHLVDLRFGPAAVLHATFGSSPTDMWAVGDEGTVLHYDGRNTVLVPSGTTANLNAVWGTGPNDVWMVGARGTVLHYDGRSFASVSSGTDVELRAVFTVAPDDVWIAGDQGVVEHGSVLGFDPMTVPDINALPIHALHGLASDDVWLGGGNSVFMVGGSLGFVSHFDGTAWSPIQILTPAPPRTHGNAVVRIWELAPTDIWALTDIEVLGDATGNWHYDGATWSWNEGDADSAAFMFPPRSGAGTFAFGPHDQWRTRTGWQRSTQ